MFFELFPGFKPLAKDHHASIQLLLIDMFSSKSFSVTEYVDFEPSIENWGTERPQKKAISVISIVSSRH